MLRVIVKPLEQLSKTPFPNDPVETYDDKRDTERLWSLPNISNCQIVLCFKVASPGVDAYRVKQ